MNYIPKGDFQLDELKLIRAPISIQLDTSFGEALTVLSRNRITGVALVDYEFHIRGNFSASDLRGAHTDFFDYFQGSIVQFMTKATDSHLKQAIYVSKESSLKALIELVAASQVHRVYIADDNQHPIGVVTLTDIITHLHNF